MNFLKILKYQISLNPTSGSRVLAWGRTDGLDEADVCFSQFCENA